MTKIAINRHPGYDAVMAKHEATATLNISLPLSQRQFIEAEVAAHGYSSVSEYIRELVRERQRARAGASDGAIAGAAAGSRAIDRKAAQAAVRRILELQQQLSLKGLTIEELIDEGRA